MDSKTETMLVLMMARVAEMQGMLDVILQSQAALTAYATGQKDYTALERELRESAEAAASQHRQAWLAEVRAALAQRPPGAERN